MNYDLIFSILILLVFAGLAFIPANIAKGKGYSFELWWFYGWMLFIVAIIHASLIRSKSDVSSKKSSLRKSDRLDALNELKKYNDLFDSGVITADEYQEIKKHLL